MFRALKAPFPNRVTLPVVEVNAQGIGSRPTQYSNAESRVEFALLLARLNILSVFGAAESFLTTLLVQTLPFAGCVSVESYLNCV